MYFGLLINLGKWAVRMLLPEPARPFGIPVFEIQGFLSVFSLFLRTEKIIARCEERLNFVRRLQRFPISPNRLFEAFVPLETMAYI
jgi:hypothetical protein